MIQQIYQKSFDLLCKSPPPQFHQEVEVQGYSSPEPSIENNIFGEEQELG
jgi:hypothetical protein